ncbi:xanthine dehydrogenase family protein molybdopterin-binding subunit [Actinoplanes sp. NEAU-A12]|uniref:Xanthine dehydrogenase family protein molybdopterin-binding subunit n=1 Tax=Actinoplanes sandaracinus TaxID=3045177 RepID=A0ABT6WL51_9ACTN|nr:xanthine dehydrogenase family protein molybdopterin-binding subunit [Actinoplanes sandaracinus]MDI6100450.1 xanthine dehydrogenase family protein molybdopterin-binding subunit [Actinoplanes sandaracinus]
MSERVFGAGLKPREDPALLRGERQYTADIALPGTVHMEFLRSEHGHATIRGIDVTEAQAMPGVLRIVTGADLEGHLMPLPCIWVPGGVESHFPPHPYGLPGAGTALATGRVRFIGEPVAAVVAETRAQAADAARAIRVDYEVLPAVITPEQALADGAPQLHDAVPGNLNARWTCGDADGTEAALAEAEVVVKLDLHNRRTINSPLEPRAAVGDYDPLTGEYTLYATTQSPHNHRFLLSALVLGIPFNKLRVVAPEIGGSFGTKGYLYPDMPLVLFLAKELGRPVKWQDSREGLMCSTVQGRDHRQYASIAGTRDGKITALKCTSYANLGAYPSTIGPGVATALMGRSITGTYDIEHAFCEVFATFTNTVPLGAQRGSGRAEATFLIERLVDRFAATIGMDPAEVRRRNMVRPEQQPFDNRMGWLYDSGDYGAALERALEMAGYADREAAKRAARARGKLLGVGISTFVAVCGVGPSPRIAKEGMLGGSWESANIRVHPTGEVTLTIGVTGTGQSHETTFAQIVAQEFGVAVDSVQVLHSDTTKAPYGQGTYGSRSYSVGGPAVQIAARQVTDKMRLAAAHMFGVDDSAVVFRDGSVLVEGDPEKTKTFQDMAMALWYGWDLPPGMEPAIDVTTTFDPADFNYPYGAHIAVVEVDEVTGDVELVRYIAVNDVGPVGNPLVVDGQIEGSIVHGVGQALMEVAQYDQTGALLTANLDRYAIPRAADVPFFELDRMETPTPHNPLGAKGAGEAATVPTAAAVTNAVCDALAEFGVQHIDMPLTAETVWRAMNAATTSRSEAQ